MNDESDMNGIEKLDPEDDLAKDILSPEWAVVETHFGASSPDILKDLY